MSDASLESDSELAEWSPPPALRAQLGGLLLTSTRAAAATSSSTAAAAQTQPLQEGESAGEIPEGTFDEMKGRIYNCMSCMMSDVDLRGAGGVDRFQRLPLEKRFLRGKRRL